MLTSFRELLRSRWAGGLLFGLVILAMALWIDDPSSFLGGNSGKAVSAGDRGFTMSEFDQQVEQFLFRQRNEGGITSRLEAVETGSVDQLFAFEAVRMARLGYAERIGAEASESSVLEDIRETEVFNDPLTGGFSSDEYRRVLRTNQLTPELYEQNLKDTLTLELVSRAANGALIAPSIYRDLQASYLAEARSLSWFTVSAELAGDLSPPSEDDIQDFYTERTESFSIPERRSFSVMRLAPVDFVHRVSVAPEDLRAIYESQKAQRFSGPDSRRFVEIAATSEAAALDAFGRMAGGARSEDLEQDAGITGVTQRTATQSELPDNELNTQLFDDFTRPGAVVGPVELSGIWFVARLEEVIPGTPIPFEDVSGIIEAELAESEAQNLFAQAEAELFDQIGAGLTLEDIAREVGTPIITYVPLTQSARLDDGRVIPGLAGRPDIMASVFDGIENVVSDPVEGEADIVLTEVHEIIAPRTPPLDEIRERVEAAYAATTDAERLSNFASELVDRVETGGQSMADVADALGIQLQTTSQPISRANAQAANAPPNALASAFGANEGDTFSAPGPGPGEVTIMRVDSIQRPSQDEIQVLGQVVGATLDQSLQNDLLEALDAEFREAIGFEVNTRALDVYKQQILDQQQ